MSIYGVLGSDGGFIQTSRTERGAKNHAKRNGYRSVYRMCESSWYVTHIATRTNGRWHKVQS
jgi:hypothetical protein